MWRILTIATLAGLAAAAVPYPCFYYFPDQFLIYDLHSLQNVELAKKNETAAD